MIFTSSYSTPGMTEYFIAFVESIDPASVIEIGTQQGFSSALLLQGMQEGTVYTYDLFETKYPEPPYLDTHSNMEVVEENVKEFLTDNLTCKVYKGDYLDAFDRHIDICGVGYAPVDLLHIDICNHYDNLAPILEKLSPFVQKGIILEGGGYNNWQKKYSYLPYAPLLEEMSGEWNHETVSFNEHNAITTMTRK